MHPFFSFFLSYCDSLFLTSRQFFRRLSSSSYVNPARLRWPHILLHAQTLPRCSQPTARRNSLPPNLPTARPSHDKTPQHPIAVANSYTTLVIPRDVPSITTGGSIAREPA
jgi:hypothetical protein